ncbi:hypothetical protein [Human fecal virus Jorvi4]|uniref:hypothetical protein n=1 Tax=Human fecal virus Jorvi4 TaxID=2017083 RepID=UPI000B5BBBE3|nr:hypothetical protein [Human fecal virus Jorvi4]ASH99043.1 hypothetical protein [Human fecal virus Jorvi4]
MARRGYRYKRYYGKNRKRFIGPLLPGGYAKGNAKSLARKWRRRRYRYGKKSKQSLRSGWGLGMTRAKSFVKRVDLNEFTPKGSCRFRISYRGRHLITAANVYCAANFHPHPHYPTTGFADPVLSATSDDFTSDPRTMDHAGLMGALSNEKFMYFKPVWMKTIFKVRVTGGADPVWTCETMGRKCEYSSSGLPDPYTESKIETDFKTKMSFYKILTAGKTCKYTLFSRLGENKSIGPGSLQNPAATLISNYIKPSQWLLWNETIQNMGNWLNYPVHQLIVKSGSFGIGAVDAQRMGLYVEAYHTVHCLVAKNNAVTQAYNTA